jgi:5'-nucleotidase
MGRPHFWVTVIPVESTEEGTDRWAIEQRFVSMTPLSLDLTEHVQLEKVRKLESWGALSFH